MAEGVWKLQTTPEAISAPTSTVRCTSTADITPSFGSRGGRRTTPGSPGSKVSASTLSPFVTEVDPEQLRRRVGHGEPQRDRAR